MRDICNDLSYSCFDTEGVKLVKILMDLLKYEDDDLRLSSMLLLFNMYQVSWYYHTIFMSFLYFIAMLCRKKIKYLTRRLCHSL